MIDQDKYTARSMAKKYLDSCDENAILFSIGDNDTFAFGMHKKLKATEQMFEL